MGSLHNLFILLFLGASVYSQDEPCLTDFKDDQSVLLCFKNKLVDSSILAHWNPASPNLSSWNGITWKNGRVIRIDLSSFGLAGNISWPFWCHLPSLEYLNLSNNSFRGELGVDPSSCSSAQLSTLDISLNLLEGTIPSTLSTFQNLRYLALHGNSLVGGIPATLFSLTQLEYLNLARNALTGHLPSEVGNCSNLLTLNLMRTTLTGPIPSSVGQLSRLQNFLLRASKFDGTIPESLANCTELQLLDLSGNGFTGHIPDRIFTLEKLQRLRLSLNNLTGNLPKNMSNLQSLKVLEIPANKLEGSLPADFGSLKSLKFLDIGYNRFCGSIPDNMASLASSLQYFSLVANGVSGNLPSWLGNFTKLRSLDFWQNRFTGTIPPEFSNITAFQTRNMTEQQDPDTKDIQLNIMFSPTGGSSKSTLSFTFSVYPTTLDLCDNQLTGIIPHELGKLSNLQHLWLCTNNLTGTIPSSLSSATSLMLLQLYDNKLSGRIPSELGGLSFLAYFNVSNNLLSGRIPRNGQMNTFNDPSSFLGNPELCGPPLNISCPDPEKAVPVKVYQPPDYEVVTMHVPVGVGAAFGFSVGLWSAIFLLPRKFLYLTRLLPQ